MKGTSLRYEIPQEKNEKGFFKIIWHGEKRKARQIGKKWEQGKDGL
jgi:hypothetical protein